MDGAVVIRRRRGVLALVLLALAWATVMQALGWAQTSYYALAKSLSDGTATIDRYHWETRDKAWTGGHFYSVKAPGLPFLILPLYAGLKAVGGPEASRDVARAARESGDSRWAYHALLVSSYGYDRERAKRTRDEVEGEAPMVWALGLLGSVLPALGLLLIVRRLAERVTPGYGTAAAFLLGAGTLIMVFASQLFGHVLATLLAFGAFALLWRERDGPPRLWWVAAAGLLSGLAVTTEYPVAIAGAIVGLYALARPARLRRAIAYAGGVAGGVTPVLLYNLWAYGSVRHMSYKDAVDRQGYTGHWTLGLNGDGFFGIGVPNPETALHLLIASRGLLVISPLLAAGAVGTWLLYCRGRRAEALTIFGVAVAFWIYDAGYWLPFGGGSPGPRFLIPILPFLCVGLGLALKRLPAVTLGLAAPSVLTMMFATTSHPLIGDDDVGVWIDRLAHARFANTPLVPLGGTGWLAIAPFVALVAAALVCTVRATERLDVRADLPCGALAVLWWAFVAAVGPAPWGDAALLGNWNELAVVGLGTAAGFATLAVATLGARAPGGAPARRRRSAGRPEVIEHDPAADLAT